jgi:tetratricopeptide (TPR) repeat protein
MKRQNKKLWALLALVVALPAAWACGPSFPNWLLGDGDRAALVAPVADFFREISRLKNTRAPRFQTVPPDTSHPAQTADAEWQDLQAALEQLGIPEERREAILREHAASREIVKRRQELLQYLRKEELIEFVPPPVARGLPAEFADYFRGSIAFHQGNTEEARALWTALLKRPAEERPFRSTWAAFMLGRLDVEGAPERAVDFFQKVRELAAAGFADTLGLAAASYGWEARAWLNRKEYARAMELYADHVAAGDTHHAVNSLRITAALACGDGAEALRPLTKHPLARSIVTAHLISRMHWNWALPESDKLEQVLLWVTLLEENEIREVELAEQLALAAYQSGLYNLAQRWLDRADDRSPLTLWLRAKLELRAGRIEEAAALLGKVVRLLPIEEWNAPAAEEHSSTLAARLSIVGYSSFYHDEHPSAARHVLGELGTLRLHRREFIEALDALLRSGHWMDAAYVAERILTPDELKNYVDRHWGEAPLDSEEGAERAWGVQRATAAAQSESIRYLLARRLARAGRNQEAALYFPAEWRQKHEERVALLRVGRDAARPQPERARSLWEAARLTRALGMELLGTELEPDWTVHGGAFEIGLWVEHRRESALRDAMLQPSDAELRRAANHEVEPPKRFHYRYIAAEIAWEAARLMPDNEDQTARVLLEAGSWLKHRDPEAADRFYKALVRRCGNTEIGKFADKLRWFPLLDEEGRPFAPKPRPEAIEFQPLHDPAELDEGIFTPAILL